MKRIVILGRGAAGKSTFARTLGRITGIPVIELDKLFWQAGLVPMTRDEWVRTQRNLVSTDSWIMDGDLGPYDAPEIRLSAADTVVILDYSLARCAWNAVRRSRERLDFWWWLMTYRFKSRPALLRAISTHARHTRLYTLRNPKAVPRLLAELQLRSVE